MIFLSIIGSFFIISLNSLQHRNGYSNVLHLSKLEKHYIVSDRQGKPMIGPVSEKNNVDEQDPLWGRSKAGSAGQHVYITNKQNKAVGSESRML